MKVYVAYEVREKDYVALNNLQVDFDCAGAVRHVNQFGEKLLELWRPCALNLIVSFGNEVRGVLEAWDSDRLFPVQQRKGHRAGDCLTVGLLAIECDLYHNCS